MYNYYPPVYIIIIIIIITKQHTLAVTVRLADFTGSPGTKTILTPVNDTTGSK